MLPELSENILEALLAENVKSQAIVDDEISNTGAQLLTVLDFTNTPLGVPLMYL